jgi:carbon starvation protein CstA
MAAMLILLIVIALITIIGSFYGLGKYSNERDKQLEKNVLYGTGGIGILIVLSIIIYVFVKNYNLKTSISIATPIIFILVSTVFACLSSYGIGKEEENKDKSSLYDVAIIFTVISTFVLLISLMVFAFKFNKIDEFSDRINKIRINIDERVNPKTEEKDILPTSVSKETDTIDLSIRDPFRKPVLPPIPRNNVSV